MENLSLSKQQKENFKYLLTLLKSVINETAPSEPNEQVDFQGLFGFAKIHKVANTAFYGIEQLNSKPESELYKKWQNLRNKAVHKFLIQTTEYQSIVSHFKKAEISFLPIKGLPISNLYPKAEYRDMADLDFLIKGDLKKAGDVLLSIGYKADEVGSIHHDSYQKPPFMILEIHRDIVRIDSPFHKYYEDIFDRSIKVDDFEYKMTDEDFYIFNLVHTYKHYSTSGCGIRQIMDLYILNKNLLPQLDREYINNNLKEIGLLDFFNLASEIADKWFGKGDAEDFSEVELYILTSGAYGTTSNRMRNSHKGKSKGKYILTKLFPSVATMKSVFPILRKHYALIPVYYVRRIIVAVFTKREKIKTEFDYMKKDH